MTNKGLIGELKYGFVKVPYEEEYLSDCTDIVTEFLLI